jgi:hypothetical protein
MVIATPVSKQQRRLELAKGADAILKRARCDAMTGAKKDRDFRRNKRAESKRLGRHWCDKRNKLGKLGPASAVRIISEEETQKD